MSKGALINSFSVILAHARIQYLGQYDALEIRKHLPERL